MFDSMVLTFYFRIVERIMFRGNMVPKVFISIQQNILGWVNGSNILLCDRQLKGLYIDTAKYLLGWVNGGISEN